MHNEQKLQLNCTQREVICELLGSHSPHEAKRGPWIFQLPATCGISGQGPFYLPGNASRDCFREGMGKRNLTAILMTLRLTGHLDEFPPVRPTGLQPMGTPDAPDMMREGRRPTMSNLCAHYFHI